MDVNGRAATLAGPTTRQMGSFARSSSPLVETVAEDCHRETGIASPKEHNYDLEYQLPTEAP
jgi:hypothetical protein